MKTFYKIILLCVLFFCFDSLNAQTTITTTSTGNTFWSASGGAIVFGVRNTNSFAINVTDLGNYCPVNHTATYTLWYHPTVVTGVPGAITTTNGWVQLPVTYTVPTTPSAGIVSLFANIGLTIPSNTVYRLALVVSANGPYYSTSGNSADIFSADGLDILTQANSASPTYVGPITGPTSTPRGFFGTLTFSPATPCTVPTIGGATLSNLTNVCAGSPFNLSLSSTASSGTGLTYQWDSSSNGTTWFPILGATSRSIVKSQLSTSSYRCNITCGASTAQSTPVQVTSPSLISANTFSINSGLPTGGTNFQTFTDAINFISCGINGPVTFNVLPGSGPYTEQLTIPQIFGASNTNRITINGNGATLSFGSLVTSTTVPRHGILLNGADYVTINNLVIDGTAAASTNAAWGIVLTNQADSNVVRNCSINIGNLTSTSTNFIGVVLNGSATAVSSSGNNANGNQFLNNNINGGYYNYYLYGSSTSTTQNINNVIRGGNLQDAYQYGVYSIYQSLGLVVDSLDLSRPTRTISATTTAGVFITTGTRGALVQRNRVHNWFDGFTTSTSTTYGVYIGADATTANPNRVINNVVYNMGGNGTLSGIHNVGGDSMQVYHNTIVLNDAAATTGIAYGIYQTTLATGIDIKNNIVVVTRSGTGVKRCIFFNTTTSTITSNNNVLLMNAAAGADNRVGQFGTTNFTTLADWKTANTNAYDQLSVSEDPLFVNAASGDFKPTAANINDIGATGTGVGTDILNIVRGANPDPGAYEFSIGGCTNPPTPGTATTTASNICANTNFTLGLSGNSIGTGLTYQWQSSTTDSAPWSNVGAAQTTPTLITAQTVSNFYRCALTCNAGTTVFSTSVQVTSPALVSGTFTINSGQPTAGTSFQTFAAAINFMGCGINGPVTFNVLGGSGPYTEQVTIPQIVGASNTNRITFNGNDAVIQFDPVTANRHVIKLDNADYITLDNLQIRTIGTTSTSFGWGIHLTNGSDYNSISRCKISIGSSSTTESNSAGIVVSGSSTAVTTAGSASFNVISNNTIDSAYNGIIISGTATSLNARQNVITNNLIRDFYANGISMTNTDSTIVSFNDISRERRTAVTTFSGVQLASGNIKCIVNGNKIHDTHNSAISQTGTAYGISSVSNDATTGVENRVINNLIYNMNSGSGTIYGLYNSSSDGVLYYHNTIVLNNAASTAGVTAGFYQTTAATGIALRNNIFSITRGGTGIKRCLQFITNTSTISSNNNLLYMNAPDGTDNKIGQWGAAASSFTTLTDWRTANSGVYDAQSLDIDPLFANAAATDFKPTSSILDGKGTPVGVLKDIVDSTRSSTTPDMGAYEFSTITAGLNFAAQSLVGPVVAASGCYSNAETVTINIKNSSSVLHNFVTNPVTVTVNVTGAATQTLTTIVNTGTLASDASLDVVLPTTLNMSTTGIYTFNASTTLTGDVNTANDAMIASTRTKIVLAAGTAAASPNTFCAVGGILPTLSTVGLTGATSLQWQESNTSNTGFSNIPSATNNSFTVTSALTQDKYYRLVATCAGTSVNSLEDTVIFSNPTIVSTTPATRCGAGTVSLGATASAGATVNWYAAASGGISLFTGTTYTTPSIAANTTYFAEASTGAGTQNVASPTAGTSTFFSAATGWGLRFTVNNTVTINSVKIYALNTSAGAASMQIRVTDLTDAVLYTGILHNFSIGTTLAEYTIPVGITIPPGSNYKMVMTSTGISQLVRESSGVTFPYNSPSSSVTITAGSNGVTTAQTTAAYYWFYSWVISEGCVSTRTPVIATIDNNPACGTLPVTLTNFKGDKIGNANALTWTTISEINNQGFEVERSIDGINFSSIGFVASNSLSGNSNTPLVYNFNDTKGFTSNSYYRLKQIDKDGKFAYSITVLLKANKVKELTITNIYPNPTKGNVNVAVESPNNDRVSFIVADVTGKVVAQKVQLVNAGNNIVNLATSGLASGSYFIKMVCGNGCQTLPIRFVKD